MNKQDTLPIGRITGLHGVAGEIKLVPYGDIEDLDIKSVYVELGGTLERLSVKRMRWNNAHYLISFDGFSTRNASEALVGLEVLVRKEDLPVLPNGEYYYADILGTEVWTDAGVHLGTIENIIPTGATDVYEVHGGLGEVLIPAAPDVVVEFDPKKKKMVVRLLEGLVPETKSE